VVSKKGARFAIEKQILSCARHDSQKSNSKATMSHGLKPVEWACLLFGLKPRNYLKINDQGRSRFPEG
jgi:hypothetical protein